MTHAPAYFATGLRGYFAAGPQRRRKPVSQMRLPL